MENDVNDKNLTVERNKETAAYAPKEEQNRPSVSGRANIDEISKRNEEITKQEKKSSYTIAGIIVVLIIVVMFLVYFFN